MRYEYLILPPRPESFMVRMLRTLRALFQHPGRVLMIGLLLLLMATQLNAQTQNRAALKERIRQAGNRVIIGMRPNVSTPGMRAGGQSAVSETAAQTITRNLERKGLRVTGRVTLIPAVFGEVSQSDLDALMDDPNVEYVEPDEPQPLAVKSSGAVFRYAEQTPWGIPRVTAPDAWALGGSAAYGGGVKVAFLDSGGDADHPDLLWAGGYSAITGSTAASAWDDNIGSCYGHGTHVAGTIAARMNDAGVVGVAPGASLYAIKVFEDLGGSCLAYQSKQIAGLNWAVQNGIKVVSISIGGTTANSSYQSAITAATSQGVYVVAAAGNNGSSTLTYPGAYQDVLSVGALDGSNNRSSYSNYGPKLYITAPGDGILSTVPGGYGYKSGTSMATPHVAGVVALVLARFPGISRSDLLARLQQGALDLGIAGRDDNYGWGLARSRESMDGSASVPPPVPLALSLSPLLHRDTVTAGATMGHPDSATVSLTGDNSTTTPWTASARRTWTVLTTASGTGSGKLRWTRNPTGLAIGMYVDTITVTAGGLTARLMDTLRVNAAPAPSPLAVTLSPNSRYKSVKAGTTQQQVDSGSVQLSGTGSTLATWTAFSAKPWTVMTTAAGTGSGPVRWSRNPTNLVAGTYVDTITVVVPTATNSPSIIIDSLVVTATVVKGKGKSRTVGNGNSSDGGSMAANDSVWVELEPGLAWTVETTAPWIELSRSSGEGPGWLFWRRDFSVMPQGISEDSLVVYTGAGNDREAVFVVNETLVTGADEIPADLAANTLLGASAMNPLQQRMLDLLGNGNGRYDLGDFLAYFDRTGATLDAALMTRVMKLRR